jgi:CheY-like chemotaxis protein
MVLDLVLPRLSGVEVFRRCRRLRPDLPVILSSGNVYEGLDAPDVRAGIAGVLPKPYRPEELISLVERVLVPKPGNGLGG